MSADESVRQIIREVKTGDEDAINAIWDRCFPEMVRQAGQKLASKGVRIADGEDVAISVFESFCRAAQNGRFPDLHDNDGLWRLLSTMTRRKVIDWIRKQSVRPAVSDAEPLEQIAGTDGGPEIALILADETEYLLNQLPEKYRHVALKKLECYSNREIADLLDISLPTVERRLRGARGILEIGQTDQ